MASATPGHASGTPSGAGSPFERRLLRLETGGVAPSDSAYSGLVRAQSLGREWLLDEIEAASLRGKGGAGFPTALKWRGVARGGAPRHVVVNGDEGELVSWKDRYLLRRHPHLVLEGAALAAFAVDAASVHIYVSDSTTASVVATALKSAGPKLEPFSFRVVEVPHTYVAGEETSVVNFLNGRPALPSAKPPRPHQSGVSGQPTLVNNVETFAHAAYIARHGAGDFRAAGVADCPGTFLACVSGAVPAPVLLEVAYGTPLSAVIEAAGARRSQTSALLLGGYFSGLLPGSMIDTPALDGELRRHGFGLGNGNIVVLGGDVCPIGVTADLFAFFAKHSAGQCGPCVRGTQELLAIGAALRAGTATHTHLQRLNHLGEVLKGRGACSLLDAAALTAVRTLQYFNEALASHVGQSCSHCRARAPAADGGFAIEDLDRLMN